MPNQWNDLGSGILEGTTNFLNGLFEGQAKKHARETYDIAMQNMKHLLNPPTAATIPGQTTPPSILPTTINKTGQNNEDDDDSDEEDTTPQINNTSPQPPSNTSTSLNTSDPLTALLNSFQPKTVDDQGGIQQRQLPGGGDKNPPPGTPKDMLDAYYNGIINLQNEGDYGTPYIPLLKDYYDEITPDKVTKHSQVADGYLITYDDNGKLLSKTPIADQKNQPYKMGSDWEIQENQDESGNGNGSYNYYQPTATGWTKTPLTASERDFQRQEGTGEFAPKGPGRVGGMGHLKIPKLDPQDASTKQNATDLFNTKRQIAGMGGWQNIQNQINQLSQVGSDMTDSENKNDPAYKTAQSKIAEYQGVLNNYNTGLQTLKGLGVQDPDTFAEDVGQGTDLKTAKQNQDQIGQDMNTVIYAKNGIYDNLSNAWNLDSSDPNQATQIQSILKNLYDWMGQNIYGTALAKPIYDYVNGEVQKLAVSKGLK